MRWQSLPPILMAILTASSTIICPNRCLSFRSASSIAARSRAQHRCAPSLLRKYLLREPSNDEPLFGEKDCPRRPSGSRPPPAACFVSALLSSSPPHARRLPPSKNNYPALASSIGPTNARTMIHPEQQYTLCYDGRSRLHRGTTATGGGGAAASSSAAVSYDVSGGIEVWSSSHHCSGDMTTTTTTIEQNANRDARNRERKTTTAEEMKEDDRTSNFIDGNLDSILSDTMNRVNPDKPYILRFDGASSRGNPGGAAGSGMVLYDIGGDEVWSGCQYLGDETHTNNEAEYIALMTGLRAAPILGVEHIIAQGDGPLVLRQVEGANKVNSAKLKPLYDRAMSLKNAVVSFHTSQIERTQNERADELAIEAVNTRGSSFEVHHMAGNRDATPSPRNEEEDDEEDELKQYIEKSLEDIDEKISVDVTRKASISDDTSRKGETLDPQQTYILCFDGGSRGNPGIAGAGMVLCDQVDGHEIWSGCQYIGDMSTNNEAEYTALITGLRTARSMGVENILVQGDSQLILRQIDGVYRVKSEKLRPYYEKAMSLRREFTSFQTNHIERSRNARADELANEAMNNKSSRGIDVPH